MKPSLASLDCIEQQSLLRQDHFDHSIFCQESFALKYYHNQGSLGRDGPRPVGHGRRRPGEAWSQHEITGKSEQRLGQSTSAQPWSFALTNKILWIRFINNAFNILSDNSYIITDFYHGNILPEGLKKIGTWEGNISLTSHRIRYSDSMILTINESWMNRWLIQ